MSPRERQMRRVFVTVLFVIVGGMLAISTYTLWRLRSDAIARGLEMSAMHSRSFEDMLTQTLHVTALVASYTLIDGESLADPARLSRAFVATLRQAPFLRSLSLLDERGRIVASSNPDNVGIAISTEVFLPPAFDPLRVLRIGRPWVGRDFASGFPSSDSAPVPSDGLSLVPVAQMQRIDGRTVTLLAALNPDYFVNHFAQKLTDVEGTVDVLLYDGTLLMTSDPVGRPGLRDAAMARMMQLAAVESGEFTHRSAAGHPLLTSYRASNLYPLVVFTNYRRDFALRHWRMESFILTSVVVPVLSLITLLAFAFYRRQVQLAAQRAESERLQRINAIVFDLSSEATLITDLDGAIISVNPSFTRVTGFEPNEVIGLDLRALLTPEGREQFPEPAPRGGEWTGSQGEATTIEVQLCCADERLLWMEILSTPENDAHGECVGYRRIGRNITERKQMEDQVKHLAFHDSLTRLPNRHLLYDRLQQALAASKRSGSYGALLFLDLDNFKPLNDTHGHAAGDALLIEVAERLKACVREIDTVARFGGDEFVLILNTLSPDRTESIRQTRSVTEKISAALSRPYRLELKGRGKEETRLEHLCTSSIGVSLFLDHDPGPEDILKQADSAMYLAKAAGRNQIRFYDPAESALGQTASTDPALTA